MPAERTEITEIVTGLGMLGSASLEEGLRACPQALVNVTDEHWRALQDAWHAGRYRAEFVGAFANGQAFFRAREALRWRTPLVVEWKGPHRLPAYESLPADLRVDHVYLVSCKYLSRILVNASPFHLFDRALDTRTERAREDWYQHVAPGALENLYRVARSHHPEADRLATSTAGLTRPQRVLLKKHYHRSWPAELRPVYRDFSHAVAEGSCNHWEQVLPRLADRETLLWRLLRLSSAPYFVLGVSGQGSLRLRIGTPWDWRQGFRLTGFDFWPEDAGQPQVAWRAEAIERETGRQRVVEGHVEIRWSHGKFSGAPEAKVYLDTPYTEVPGYYPLV